MNSDPPLLTRRRVLQLGSVSLLALHAGRPWAAEPLDAAAGIVIGQPQGAEAARRVLADGGNAADAIVAAALVAGVVAVPSCGIGGYGGHLVVGYPDGRVTAIDFNSTAPAATRQDMFPLDDQGRIRGGINSRGWLAAGVPGTLAGLQLAIDRCGTRSLGQLIEPAIRFARDGFPVSKGLGESIGRATEQFQRDEGSAKLFFKDGRPLAEGDTFRNRDLAAMLEKLARDGRVADFYQGEIAARVASAFRQHAGLVTEQDLAAYEARELAPLSLDWRGSTIHTAPLTAGGLSVLEALGTLRALGWENDDPSDPRTTHARIEALRLAWHDRLTLLGDPDATDVPVARLLSADYAAHLAQQVQDAVRREKLIPQKTDGRTAGGTIHLTAADSSGMMAAMTLTHGEAFGAQVTVDGLGLILGHGMSRFEPRPGHPNAPRAGRRPLNNMCPTLVTRDERPIAALGASGGRRIPNTLYDVLVQLVGRGQTLSAAAAAPRMHTEGDAVLQLAKGWSERDIKHLELAGYTIQSGSGANLNGIARDPASGALTPVP